MDGSERPVKPADGRAFTLAELYALVGCETVEMIRMADGRLLWMDEEAKLARIPKRLNARATVLLQEAGGRPGDFILGPVLITTPAEGGEEPDDEEPEA